MPNHRTPRLSALLCILLVASLASCGTPRRAGLPGDAAGYGPAPVSNPDPGSVSDQPAVEKPRGPALPAPRVPEIASLPTADRLPGPESLVGLPAHEISALLGEPDFRRRDPPAELWQYTGPRCTLDLFLFDKNGNGEQRVIHLEARGPTVARVPVRDCYLDLVQARRKPAGGG